MRLYTITKQDADQFPQFLNNFDFFSERIVTNHEIHMIYIPSDLYYQTSDARIRMPAFSGHDFVTKRSHRQRFYAVLAGACHTHMSLAVS